MSGHVELREDCLQIDIRSIILQMPVTLRQSDA